MNVFQPQPLLAKAFEISTPEAVLSIFIAIVLIIPLMSTITRIAKHNKLNETLRIEAIQRSGMTEAELNKLLEKPKKKKGIRTRKRNWIGNGKQQRLNPLRRLLIWMIQQIGQI